MLRLAAVMALAIRVSGQDFNELGPVTVAGERDDVLKAVRDVRNQMFNLFGLPPMSEEKAGIPPRITSEDLFAMPDLPVDRSDLVAVATVEAIRSHVLPGEVGIYTEYIARVVKVVRNEAKWGGEKVTLVHLGGAVRMPSGHVARHDLRGNGLPIEAGGEYLMFLNYSSAGECFQIVKLWRVREGKLYANNHADRARAKLGTSQTEGKQIEAVLASIGK